MFSACKKDVLEQKTSQPVTQENPPAAVTPEVPFVDGFNFKTTKDVKLSIALKTNNEQPLPGIVVSVYLPGNQIGEPVFKGVTNTSGVIQGSVTIASTVTGLIIDPAYIGLIRNAEASIAGDNTVTATIGGKDGFSGNILPEDITFTSNAITDVKTTSAYKTSGYQTTALLATSFVYPGTYTASTAIVNNATYPKALGRPVYLEATSDVLDASLLSYINASLPENLPLTTTHPSYLNSTVTSTLNVTAKTDVYVTFVSEGADQKNTLGYYTYPTGSAPNVGASLVPILGGIDKITWVFPNASANGSGGGLKAGDKVKLGNFAAGTTIAFVMIKNGWSGTDVTAGNTKFYSNDSYNPGSKKQSILLYDDVHKKFVSSFEDIDRSGTGSDNDFNDLVIYSTSSVAGAISTTSVATIDRGGDTDGDGIQDAQDEFPNDAARAFTSYYPSKTVYGTIAFEDMWPKMSDYDMNDMVVSYRYSYILNSKNQVVNLKADFQLRAVGTIYKNGLGVELPVAASTVKSVTGQRISGNYITMAANGVESGQTKAVIIPFDNTDALFPGVSNAINLNVYNHSSKFTAQTVSLNIEFNSPLAQSAVLASNFNPFLIARQERGREIHLMGYKPTAKANAALFDTQDDATVPAQNKYYLSLTNKPFGIMFSDAFQYPTELNGVDKVYKMYSPWATSSGLNHADWYSNTASAYRVSSMVYSQ